MSKKTEIAAMYMVCQGEMPGVEVSISEEGDIFLRQKGDGDYDNETDHLAMTPNGADLVWKAIRMALGQAKAND